MDKLTFCSTTALARFLFSSLVRNRDNVGGDKASTTVFVLRPCASNKREFFYRRKQRDVRTYEDIRRGMRKKEVSCEAVKKRKRVYTYFGDRFRDRFVAIVFFAGARTKWSRLASIYLCIEASIERVSS